MSLSSAIRFRSESSSSENRFLGLCVKSILFPYGQAQTSIQGGSYSKSAFHLVYIIEIGQQDSEFLSPKQKRNPADVGIGIEDSNPQTAKAATNGTKRHSRNQ
jgi:tRNA G46 methylase TrmB